MGENPSLNEYGSNVYLRLKQNRDISLNDLTFSQLLKESGLSTESSPLLVKSFDYGRFKKNIILEVLKPSIVVDKAGSSTNELIDTLAVKLKDIHQLRFRGTFSSSWAMWAEWILRQSPEKQVEMMEKPFPEELKGYFTAIDNVIQKFEDVVEKHKFTISILQSVRQDAIIAHESHLRTIDAHIRSLEASVELLTSENPIAQRTARRVQDLPDLDHS